MIIKGVMVHGRTVIDPRNFLTKELGAEKDLVDKIHRTNALDDDIQNIIQCFEDLDSAKRVSASLHDRSMKG